MKANHYQSTLNAKLDEFLSVFPGPDYVSPIQRELAARAAGLSLQLEGYEKNAAVGNCKDIRTWVAGMNSLHKVLDSLQAAAKEARKRYEDEHDQLQSYLSHLRSNGDRKSP